MSAFGSMPDVNVVVLGGGELVECGPPFARSIAERSSAGMSNVDQVVRRGPRADMASKYLRFLPSRRQVSQRP